jgi:hypothetical protein
MHPGGWILVGLLGLGSENPMEGLEVTAEAALVGDSLSVEATVWNRGGEPISVCAKIRVTTRGRWIREDSGEEIIGEESLDLSLGQPIGAKELLPLPDGARASIGESGPFKPPGVTWGPDSLSYVAPPPPPECADLVIPAGGRWKDTRMLPVQTRGLVRLASLTVTVSANFRAPMDGERQRRWTVDADPIRLEP